MNEKQEIGKSLYFKKIYIKIDIFLKLILMRNGVALGHVYAWLLKKNSLFKNLLKRSGREKISKNKKINNKSIIKKNI